MGVCAVSGVGGGLCVWCVVCVYGMCVYEEGVWCLWMWYV